VNQKRWVPLALFLVLAFAAAGIGALATTTGIEGWYATLQKPSWNPPRALFGPVWTVLYVLMAVATWQAWNTGEGGQARRTVSLYSAQLTLNALWSVLFFGLHRPDMAFVEILILWAVLLVILFRYWRIKKAAAWLWMPYVLWVTFAAVLNGTIWSLNR
jgi:tryptophan-rich sensory protein